MSTLASDGADMARAAALIDARRWRNALDLLLAVLRRDPNNATALGLVAQCRLGLDDNAGAIQAARSALAIAPHYEHAVRLTSIALSRDGRHREAVDAADEAVRLAPNLWLAHLQRANAGLDAGWQDLATETAAQRAVALAPDKPGPHIALGRVAMAAGRQREATAAYREALRLDPSNSAARNNLAVVSLRRRRLMSAGSHLMGALRADPQSPVAAANLLVVLRSWATVVNAVSVFGCALVLNLTRDHTVTTGTAPPGDLVRATGTATDVYRLGTETLTIPDLGPLQSEVAVPHLAAVPQTDDVPVTGHPVVTTVVAIVVVALLGLSVAGVRHSMGPSVWALGRRALRRNPLTAGLLASSLFAAGALAAAAAVGMPAAQLLVTVAIAVGFVVLLIIRLSRLRFGGRRAAGRR